VTPRLSIKLDPIDLHTISQRAFGKAPNELTPDEISGAVAKHFAERGVRVHSIDVITRRYTKPDVKPRITVLIYMPIDPQNAGAVDRLVETPL
jgi:hypothetical protein